MLAAGAAAASAVATPPGMFAPARLWTGLDAGLGSTLAIIAGGRGLAVRRADDDRAALQLAAELARSHPASAAEAACPGRLVPPPRRLTRDSAPAARAIVSWAAASGSRLRGEDHPQRHRRIVMRAGSS